MRLRPINNWLPQTVGLFAAASIAVLATAPPAQPFTWPRLLAASTTGILLTLLVCVISMFLTYAALPPKADVAIIVRRTSATAACFVPLVILLQQKSIWAPLVAAFLVWTILPPTVVPKPEWTKFTGSLAAAVLLQIGVAAALGEESLMSALAMGIATAPILWRIRQERDLRGPFKPRFTIAIATLLAMMSLTRYLPIQFGSATDSTYAKASGAGKKSNGASPGFSVGGRYRGIILSPEEEQHTILVPPLPMMGRDPFRVHKDPLGIPFYGVYWLFQAPDQAPNEDAYRVKGSPDNVTFRSADLNPLKMEAHQNLGALIDISACSRIDVAIRNADTFVGSVAMELILVNTSLIGHPSQSLGQAPITSKPPAQETLSFKIPPAPTIRQFDELTIRFPRARYRATRSARIAIERFFLVPRNSQ
jgi:hypothetical protein